MDPLAISSLAVTSFSIFLSIGTAICKFIKQNRHNHEEDNNHNHIYQEHGILYIEEHKEPKLHTTHKKKENHHTANSEETELPYVVEHRQNNPMNLSGDQEELTSE